MYLQSPPTFPHFHQQHIQTRPRPRRSRRSTAEANHMSWPVTPSSVLFGGAWLICPSPLLCLRHPCKSPASSAFLGAAGLTKDATRCSVCHAPTLSAAKKRRLGSGASAAVATHADGSEPCPVALCIHAERHGMRSFLSDKALGKDDEPRSTKARPSIPPVCSFKYFKYKLLSPSV